MPTELKYDWNEEQTCAILALKKQLLKPALGVKKDLYMTFLRTLGEQARRYGDPKKFYQLWELIPDEFHDRWIRAEIWKLCFCQTLVFVLTGVDPLLKKHKNTLDFFREELFREPDRMPRTLLPERLPGVNLRAAAAAGDVSKIIFLYDTAANQGQKLKNICHILFNNGKYAALAELDKVYDCLKNFDRDLLRAHLFSPREDGSKEAFDRWCLSHEVTNGQDIWYRMMRLGTLHTMIIPALEENISPDERLFVQRGYSFTLRDFLHFLSEFQEEFSVVDRLDDFKKLLIAAEKFEQWEKEKLITGYP